MHLSQFETPVSVVDLDRLEANIARLQSYLDAHGIANRPHIKTHKVPEIAHMQIDAGAVGICCAKVGEAEVMAAAGIEDIFLAYNILGESRLERLMHLARQTRVGVSADAPFVVRGLADAARRAGVVLPVLVEFDTGMGRCGVQSPQEAADLAFVIADSPDLVFAGLMTFPCNENTDPFVDATKRLLSARGISALRISGGGTPGMLQAHTHHELTEYRAGTYVYGDRFTVQSGVYLPENIAFSVVTTVISRPTANRAILDGGSKTFSSDRREGLAGYGSIVEYPEAQLYALTEEHGHVDLSKCTRKPEIGERVTVIPNHCCVVSNLFERVVATRRGDVQAVWPVAARGKLQ